MECWSIASQPLWKWQYVLARNRTDGCGLPISWLGPECCQCFHFQVTAISHTLRQTDSPDELFIPNLRT